MLISVTAPISFMLCLLFSLYFFFFYFCFFVSVFLQTRARARLRSNNGLSVSQHYGFIAGI